MTQPKPKSGILLIEPYVGGESSVAGQAKVIKLSSNEGALGAGPKAVEAVRAEAEGVFRYPDGGSTALRQAIGCRHGMDPSRIVCGCGSDELIGLLCHAYAGTGEEVLYSEHGFLMYAIYAKSAGAIPVAAPETDLTTDVDALLAAVTERTRVVFLANPNNPTGTYIGRDELKRLRKGLREDILLVVDAAYGEYMGQPDYGDGRELVDEGANVVMTRTFSKLHGLGGLRVGWAYCPASIADVLNRARSPFNVSAVGQAAGVAAMEDVAFQEKAKAHNDTWLPWLSERLEKLGLVLTPSVTNFVLARFPTEPGRTAAEADAFLKKRGIIVRRVASYGLPDSLRITIGREEENKAVVATITAFLESGHG